MSGAGSAYSIGIVSAVFIERDERTDGGQFHSSVAAFCGAKTYNPCLRNVLLLYLRAVNTQRQLQMLSCKAAQGNDLPKVQHGL